MRRSVLGGLYILTPMIVLGTASPAKAFVPLTAPPLPQRVALADLVAVGKVTALQDELVHACPVLKIPGATEKLPYRIGVLTLDCVLTGPKDLTRAQVGFVAPRPGQELPRGSRRFAQVQLIVNQQGCFFLRKHPEEPFYVAQASYDVLDKSKAKDFGKQVALAKRSARLLADPTAALKSKELDDRVLTAAMLIFRFRTPLEVYTGKPKTAPIDAEQSKLIFRALAEGDWTQKEVPSPMAPLALFLRLGLTEADGWKQPKDLTDLPAAAQKWLRENAGTYRIERYLPNEKSTSSRN